MEFDEISRKLNELLTLYVEKNRFRGYWHLQELEEIVEELRTHLPY